MASKSVLAYDSLMVMLGAKMMLDNVAIQTMLLVLIH